MSGLWIDFLHVENLYDYQTYHKAEEAATLTAVY
jgi:hypothetical protein